MRSADMYFLIAFGLGGVWYCARWAAKSRRRAIWSGVAVVLYAILLTVRVLTVRD